MGNENEQLDPDVINLAKAIRQQESGGNYSAVGDQGTSKGAYQFHNDHFEKWAKQYHLDPTDFSPENQNKVAYYRIKELKDQGRQPSEIAAIWNGAKLINGKYEAINPKYVANVKANYEKIKGTPTASPVSSTAYNPKPFSSGAVTLPADSVAQQKAEGKNSDGSDQIVDDGPLSSILGFGKSLIEPELKGVATATRSVQAIPAIINQARQLDYSKPWSEQQPYKGANPDEIMAKPVLGQKTLGGDTVQGNLGSAATAALQGLGLKAGGFKSTVIPKVMGTGVMQTLSKGGGTMGNLLRLVAIEKAAEKLPGLAKTVFKAVVH